MHYWILGYVFGVAVHLLNPKLGIFSDSEPVILVQIIKFDKGPIDKYLLEMDEVKKAISIDKDTTAKKPFVTFAESIVNRFMDPN